ncbi:MAG: PIG-L deacetylase family protein [Acidobacteriota bacterium]
MIGPGAVGKALILAAHPDDAELAAGGTIAYLRSRGTAVTVANFTTSAYSEEGFTRRRRAAERAAQILGHRLVWVEDGRLNQVEDLHEYETVRLLDALVEEEQPDLIIGPWEGDSHGDHVQLARAALASSRRWSASLFACSPSEFRTPCFHRFQPNVFVDITPFRDLKIAAIREFNFDSDDYRELAFDQLSRQWSYFGALCGCDCAEGLMLLRQQWPAAAGTGGDHV